MVDLDCTEEQDGQQCFHGAFLFGFRGRLFQVQGNFQLIEGAEAYASVGGGSTLALGSFASTSRERNPRKRMLTALEASTKNASVAPPFDIITIKARG